jgi:hypothetical protein
VLLALSRVKTIHCDALAFFLGASYGIHVPITLKQVEAESLN